MFVCCCWHFAAVEGNCLTELLFLAVAGLDFECPAGMVVENSGNVPVSFHALGDRAYAAAGTPCQSGRLEPSQSVYCDFNWSLSNNSVETGEEMVYLAVSGTDLEANGTFAETFTGFGWLSPIVVPTMDVKLEALPSAPGDPTAGERRSLRVLRALSLVLQLASDMWLPSDSLYHLRHQRPAKFANTYKSAP